MQVLGLSELLSFTYSLSENPRIVRGFSRAGPRWHCPARGRSCVLKRNRIRIRGSAVQENFKLEKYKARICARGDQQQKEEGEERFSPVTRLNLLRLVLATAVEKKLRWRWRAASGAATAGRPRTSSAATAADASRTAAQREHPAARDGRGTDGVHRAGFVCEPEKDMLSAGNLNHSMVEIQWSRKKLT